MNSSASLGAPSAIGAAVMWIQQVLLGSIATLVAVMAVAFIGFMMLNGRIDLRRATQVVLGCFILFGASATAGAIQALVLGGSSAPALTSAPLPAPIAVSQTPTAAHDPYAGAALVVR